MSDYQTERSRLSSRGRKRKQNRLMNLLIAIVCILIVIVAGSIFFGGGSEKADQPLQTSSDGSNNNGGDNGSGASVTGDSDKDNKDDAATDESGTSTTEGTDGSSEDESQTGSMDEQSGTDDQKQDKSKEKEDQQLSGGGPEGPWEPIGTDQEPPHSVSYDDESLDWAEQIQALLYATGLQGLSEDEYILWWLGNGGGPQQSLGKISTNAKPHEWYIVHLIWVKNKGWKPTSVEKVHKENLPE
ncbi:MAG TPA: DUF1510 family protein [Bacillales bacterium]|nr:DUF1510 family protein [Bacillales bacterium]